MLSERISQTLLGSCLRSFQLANAHLYMHNCVAYSGVLTLLRGGDFWAGAYSYIYT